MVSTFILVGPVETVELAARRVQLYIRRVRFSSEQIQQIGHPVPGHYCTVKDVRGTTEYISESDWATLELVEEVCTAKKVPLQVHNTGSFIGLVNSRLRGVSATPTIVVGHQKIVGQPGKRFSRRLARCRGTRSLQRTLELRNPCRATPCLVHFWSRNYLKNGFVLHIRF
jgi:hypothetical protein